MRKPSPLRFNPGNTVYRKVNGKWVRQHDTASKYECPTEQRQIQAAPGVTIHGSFAPWHKLFKNPGKYRIVAFVEYYNALPYQDIEIIEVPKKVSTDQTQKSTAPSTNSTITPTTSTVNTIDDKIDTTPTITPKPHNDERDD